MRRSHLPVEFRKPEIVPASLPAAPLPPPARFGSRLLASAQKLKRDGVNKLRASRRAIVDAELEAWNAMGPTDTALIRAEKAAERSRAEELAFAVIVVLALTGVLWGLAEFMGYTDTLQRFIGLARQLLG